jgi:hypothetical protein
MNRMPCCDLLAALLTAATPALVLADDYPTADRVLYVESCMRDHPGPNFEMLQKCSCALDTLARQLPHEQFVTMSTALNATTIGGERGSYIRDVDVLQKQIREFRQLQAQAMKSCFITATTATR